MKQVRVLTTSLKKRVSLNREAHRAEYHKAVEGWARESAGLLRKDLDMLETGERRKLTVIDPLPKDHLGDYDRALEMIDMSIDESQLLDEDEFRHYVMDDWTWKVNWVSSTSKYTGS